MISLLEGSAKFRQSPATFFYFHDGGSFHCLRGRGNDLERGRLFHLVLRGCPLDYCSESEERNQSAEKKFHTRWSGWVV